MFRFILVITPFLCLFSCAQYYLEGPQPVDVSNIYQTPPEIRGAWIFSEPNENSPVEMDSLFIGKDFYHFVSRVEHKISVMFCFSNVDIVVPKQCWRER